MSINDFLVKYFHISKKEAFQLIQEGRVLVNDTIVRQRQWVLKHEGIIADGVCIQQPVSLQYFAYYKPRGIECTLNPSIPDNLLAAFPFDGHLFPIGRLDKQSEGLLLLTNDGKLYNRTALADAYKEKEYIVTVDNVLTPEAIQQLASGVVILRTKLTRPAVVQQINDDTFSIILT
ncbi:MAG: ribosomal large subunit pseudouridine synthase F, partial [Cytophagales bacterium]|nr:ribosomal large subunit pseudouridine synthase F [Cytophaga sp.]